MKGFKLSFYNNSDSAIVFSQYDPDSTFDRALTFKESLQENENDQFNLSFSFAKNMPTLGGLIDLSSILRVGRRLKLECENHEGNDYIDLAIISISPEGKSDNIIFNCKAIDYATYKFSRNNIGLTFDSLTDEDWIALETNNILENFANFFLERGNLRYSSNGWVANDLTSTPTQFNISLSDSNTYNALVELAKLTDTLIKINYFAKSITFYPRDHSSFIKNYWLSPNINLQQLSLNYSGEELYTVLFVEGGEDDFEFNVGLTPTLPDSFINFDWSTAPDVELEDWENENYYDQFDGYKETWQYDFNLSNGLDPTDTRFLDTINKIPYLDNFILDFDYFRNNNIIDDADYSDLFDRILNDLRKENVKFQGLFRKKSVLEYEIQKINNTIEQKCELMIPAAGEARTELDNEINDLFLYGIETPTETTMALFSTLSYGATTGWRYNDGTYHNITNFYFPSTIILNAFNSITSFITNTAGEYSIVVIDTLNPTTRYKIDFYGSINESAISYAQLLNTSTYSKYSSSLSNTWKKVTPRAFNEEISILPLPPAEDYSAGYVIYVLGDNSYYEVFEEWSDWNYLGNFNWNEESPSISFSLYNISIRYESYVQLNVYQYFELLQNYKGYQYIADVLQEKKDYLIQLIEERNSLQSEIISITNEISQLGEPSSDTYKNLLGTLKSKQELYNSYLKVCGTWDYDGGNFLNTAIQNCDLGKYNLVWQKYNDFVNSYVPSATISAANSIYNRYQVSKNTKNGIWYDIKELYDRYLLEGYYKNDIEIDPVALYYQAKIYFEKYKQPLDTYGITYLDISKVLGVDINLITVGDYINIENYNLGIIEQLNNELRVISINRDLRKSSDIQLTVDRIRNTQTILEKLLKSIQ